MLWLIHACITCTCTCSCVWNHICMWACTVCFSSLIMCLMVVFFASSLITKEVMNSFLLWSSMFGLLLCHDLWQMGFDGVFFGRIDFYDKINRLSKHSMEMVWQGNKSLKDKSNIFTGVLYKNYRPPTGFCFDITCNDPEIMASVKPACHHWFLIHFSFA